MDEVENSFLEKQKMKNLIDVILILNLHESSKTSIPFLDLKVSISNRDLSSDLQFISTDRQQFLHYTSSHPDHTKCSIIYCQALRISRICSQKYVFLKHFGTLTSWFEVRVSLKSYGKEMENVKCF